MSKICYAIETMTSTQKKISLIIFAAALLIRTMALLSWHNETSLYYVSDSYTYRQIAINLLEHHTYSMEISPTPHPDNFRTPLYPLFLLPFVYFKTSMYLPVIIQNILMALGIVWTYILATRIWGERAARYAALLFALEPFTALIGTQIMTEPIFTTLFVPALLYFALYLKEEKKDYLNYGAILLALAALTRPVAFYLFVLIPLIVFFAKNRQEIFKKIFIPLGIFFLILSPWLYFITTTLKTTDFSSLSSFDIYAYHGVYFDRWRAEHGATDRLPVIDLKQISDTLDARPIPVIKAVGLAYIKKHFFEYAFYHFIRLPRLWTDSAYANILNGLPGLHFSYNSVTEGFVDQISITHFYRTAILPIKNQLAFLILLFADLFFIITALLALINPLVYFLRHRKLPRPALLIVAFLVLYTVLASPIGGARFRIPVNFFIFVLAIDSLYLLKKSAKERTLPPT